jgi:hypothetical protein
MHDTVCLCLQCVVCAPWGLSCARVRWGATVQAVSQRQREIIDRERRQHSKLSNLFTVAFTVNLVLFLLAVLALKNLSASFAEMENVTVYDPFAVSAPACAGWLPQIWALGLGF